MLQCSKTTLAEKRNSSACSVSHWIAGLSLYSVSTKLLNQCEWALTILFIQEPPYYCDDCWCVIYGSFIMESQQLKSGLVIEDIAILWHAARNTRKMSTMNFLIFSGFWAQFKHQNRPAPWMEKLRCPRVQHLLQLGFPQRDLQSALCIYYIYMIYYTIVPLFIIQK